MTVTAIEWSDVVWNPVRGCTRVSPGCQNCYAERQARRFSDVGQPYFGLVKTHPSGEPRWTGVARCVPEKLVEPLRWKKPRRVFVNSMSDLFHEQVPDAFIAAVFGVMGAARQHTFQVLTKRPDRALEWFKSLPMDPHFTLAGEADERIEGRAVVKLYDGIVARQWPLPNVWLGVSCEDQQRADERGPLLLQCPAAVRFLSLEPLLGPIGLATVLPSGHLWRQGLRGVDWVIVGGESGPGARPCNIQWVREIVRQCDAAAIACFVKQLGAKPFVPTGLESVDQAPESILRHGEYDPDPDWWALADRKGGDPLEWPEDLRVRQWPAACS